MDRRHLSVLAFALLALAGPSPAIAASAGAPASLAAELDARWDFARADVSEARFRELLALADADTPQSLEIATQIARAQGLQGRFDDAHATLDAVEVRLRDMPAHVRIRYLLERGRVFNSSGAPARALPLFEAALDLARCGGEDYYAVDAAHMIAIAAPGQAQRLAWNLEAVSMAKSSRDPRAKRWLASLDNNLGWTYLDQNDPRRALSHFRRALAEWRAQGGPREIRIARWSVGRALRAVGDLAGAQRLQQTLQREDELAGTYDGAVFEELAEIALVRGDRDAAQGWFAKAWRVFKDDPAHASDRARLDRLAALGGIAPAARQP